MEQAIIAVDSGGSKTKICIINNNKRILYNHFEGSGSPAVVGEQKAFANIYQGIEKVFNYAQDKYDITCIILGISALMSAKDPKVYEKNYSDIFKTKVIIGNDAIMALYSIITDVYNEGILVLSGTGSAVLGIKNDKTVLTGGWGHLLTECGSSFTTVREFLCSAIRHFETTGEVTELAKKFLQEINYDDIKDFRKFMYQHTKDEVAYYSRFITEAAQKYQNEDAIALLKKAGKDLAIDVRNAHKALNLSTNAVLGFRGGFVTNSQITQTEVIEELKKYGITMKVVSGDSDPIYGAYYMAKRWGYLC